MVFDDLSLGMTVECAPAVIEKEEMLAFARAYDNVPLHTDEAYAKTTPFGGLIAPGVLSFLAVWAKYLEADIFGEELIAGKSTKIEWMKPVFAGDTLTGKATLTKLVKRSPRSGLAELTVDAYNQNGERVLTAVTEAVVKRRPDGEGAGAGAQPAVRPVEERDRAAWFQLDSDLTPEGFDEKLRTGQGYVFLDENRKVVGILRFGMFWDHTPFCNLLYVDEAHRRRGIGKALEERWEADMKKAGHRKIMTSTQADEEGQHFWRSLGYLDRGGFVAGEGEPLELIMIKEL